MSKELLELVPDRCEIALHAGERLENVLSAEILVHAYRPVRPVRVSS